VDSYLSDLRKGAVMGFCKHGNEPSDSTKKGEIYWPAEWRSASQEGLLEGVNYRALVARHPVGEWEKTEGFTLSPSQQVTTHFLDHLDEGGWEMKKKILQKKRRRQQNEIVPGITIRRVLLVSSSRNMAGPNQHHAYWSDTITDAPTKTGRPTHEHMILLLQERNMNPETMVLGFLFMLSTLHLFLFWYLIACLLAPYFAFLLLLLSCLVRSVFPKMRYFIATEKVFLYRVPRKASKAI
jgi:hypothetical protein